MLMFLVYGLINVIYFLLEFVHILRVESVFSLCFSYFYVRMAEWFKATDCKSALREQIIGSNPVSSIIFNL